MEASREHRPGDQVTIVIPCYNEAAGIRNVVEGFRRELPSATILVIDNGSTDQTPRAAAEAGARILSESRRGKGYAVTRGFLAANRADWVVMVDGDGTYDPKDIHKLLDAARSGADMAVGTRIAGHDPRAFPRGHTVGNRLFSWIVRFLFRTHISDLLSGYRVFSRRFLEEVPLVAQGFEIETELSLQALVGNFRVVEVPVAYGARTVGSQSKLRTYRDGIRILLAILAFIRDFRPLTFFGAVSLVLFAFSLTGGSIVVSEYLRSHQVPRLPLAILSSASFLLASLAAATGIILSSLNRHSAASLTFLKRQDRQAKRPPEGSDPASRSN